MRPHNIIAITETTRVHHASPGWARVRRGCRVLYWLYWPLAILQLSGCARLWAEALPPDGLVCVLPGTPPRVVAATFDAIEGWRESSNGRIELRITMTDDGPECDAKLAAGILEGARGFTHRGAYTPEVTIDHLAWYPVPEDLIVVVGHELGHAMGARHSEQPRETMWRGVVRYRDNWPPTKADVRGALGE